MRIISLILIFVFAYALKDEPIVPIPQSVEYDKQKAKIGKLLYFDPILSRDDKISCSSCHQPDKAGTDNLRFSIGAFGRIDRPMNSPPSFNAVFNCWQFWNGRAKNLKEQAQMANQAYAEMDMTPELAEKKVNKIAKYKRLFKQVYHTNYITYDMMFDAIAEFEKALITPNSRFDKYLRGDKNALNTQEKRGYLLFKAYGCVTCHNGVNMGGNSFQKIGVVIDKIDIPRGNDRFEVTHNPEDKYVYKVPSLRNIMLTYPYFHDGSVKTIDEAIEKMGWFNLGVKIPKSDIEDIKAFFKTLTGEKPKILDEK
ncbi:MAG: cytochrome-c peroxidase [Epsilonproteobacteria bacterium]|nr:cytochrome-c peroxidase [Campylobacterota bacterium]